MKSISWHEDTVHYTEYEWWYTHIGFGRGEEIAVAKVSELDGSKFLCFYDFCLYSCGHTYKQERRWSAKLSLRRGVCSFSLQVKNRDFSVLLWFMKLLRMGKNRVEKMCNKCKLVRVDYNSEETQSEVLSIR